MMNLLQGVPVAASTLSLMMLSLDRYASIEHPHLLSQLRQNRSLHIYMNMIVWFLALLAYSPLLYSRSLVSSNQHCEEIWPSYTMRVSFTLCQVIVVYLVPGLTVAACHHAVGHKLYAASLVAAAANGDIPLPMPILGRPKEVIIVASVQHDVPSKVIHFRNKDDSDEEGAGGGGGGNDVTDFRRGKGSRQQQRNKLQQKTTRTQATINRVPSKPPLTKQMSRQSLHSRRRLANMLVALVVVFATCWLPYVILKVYSIDPDANVNLIQNLLPFCLLLGHTHSAINPIVYWFLNRQSINLTVFCGHWLMRNGSQSDKGNFRFLPTKDKDRRPSSTNEAALGIFHPRYTVPKARPKPQPRESSQYYV
ncbi:cholecystokinin receptor type A [Lycorma delicatula]|uniref:cholecystokinin receptor type A n=1 Tax=Lycorma delicatula TaxID=130591 RepID=UPI003F51AC0D